MLEEVLQKGFKMNLNVKSSIKLLISMFLVLAMPFVLICFFGEGQIALSFAITSLLLTILPAFDFMKKPIKPLETTKGPIDFYNVICIAVAFVTVLATVRSLPAQNSFETKSYGILTLIFILSITVEIFFIYIIKPKFKVKKKNTN